MADGRQCVAEFAIFRGGVANAIGREQRKIERPGNRDGSPVASFLLPMEMALQLDIHIAAAKKSDQLLDLLAGFFDAAMLQSGRQQPIRAASQANETLSMLLQFFFLHCTFTFFCTYLHLGDQAAKILITGTRGDEERKADLITR